MQGLPNVHIGQTGRTLSIRYKEHVRNIRYNTEDSGHAADILNNITAPRLYVVDNYIFHWNWSSSVVDVTLHSGVNGCFPAGR
jgi:hypothetical protein